MNYTRWSNERIIPVIVPKGEVQYIANSESENWKFDGSSELFIELLDMKNRPLIFEKNSFLLELKFYNVDDTMQNLT